MHGRTLAACLLVCLLAAPLLAEEARILRYPSIHEEFVAFVHAGDIWRAPVDGGTARRLTSHRGVELTPRISPDGKWVAYSAEYSGTRQVYVIPAEGGAPKQLTFYNDVGAMPPRGGFDYWIQGWSPDGKILVRMNRTPWGPYVPAATSWSIPRAASSDRCRSPSVAARRCRLTARSPRLHLLRSRVPHLEASHGGP